MSKYDFIEHVFRPLASVSNCGYSEIIFSSSTCSDQPLETISPLWTPDDLKWYCRSMLRVNDTDIQLEYTMKKDGMVIKRREMTDEQVSTLYSTLCLVGICSFNTLNFAVKRFHHMIPGVHCQLSSSPLIRYIPLDVHGQTLWYLPLIIAGCLRSRGKAPELLRFVTGYSSDWDPCDVKSICEPKLK